jgi:hypothetical protein
LDFVAEEFIVERPMKKVESSADQSEPHGPGSVVSLLDRTQTFVRYVHILLFACPDCNLPISISRFSNEKNLETVDAEQLDITCSYCEKSSNVTAVTAKRHYVEEWA